MSVSLSEVVAGAALHAVPLSAECAGYLVLAAADQSALSPRRVKAADVSLLEDGAVRVSGGTPADEETLARDLRALLGELLLAASSPTSGLLRVQRRAGESGVGTLQKELETALIPVNRAAARRALARLARETLRARDEGRLAAALAVAVPPAPRAPTPPPVAVIEAQVEPTPAPIDLTIPLVLPAPPLVSEPLAPLFEPPEEETRPEPVVARRLSAPPSAPPPSAPVPTAPAAPAEASSSTPVLGTRVAPAPVEPPLENDAPGHETVLDSDVLVTFAEDERTVIPDDAELIVLDDDAPLASLDADPTDSCLPPLADSEAVRQEASVSGAEPDDADDEPKILRAARPEPTPLPHLPMPRPRPSDVDDLIARLGEAPLPVSELRHGLKRLAGLEPTPPPPGSDLERPGE